MSSAQEQVIFGYVIKYSFSQAQYTYCRFFCQAKYIFPLKVLHPMNRY